MRMADPQSIWPLMCANIAKAPLYNGDIESAKALIGQLSFLLRTVRADDHETVSEFLPEVANAIVARIQGSLFPPSSLVLNITKQSSHQTRSSRTMSS